MFDNYLWLNVVSATKAVHFKLWYPMMHIKCYILLFFSSTNLLLCYIGIEIHIQNIFFLPLIEEELEILRTWMESVLFSIPFKSMFYCGIYFSFFLQAYSSLEVVSEYFRSSVNKIFIGSDAIYVQKSIYVKPLTCTFLMNHDYVKFMILWCMNYNNEQET